MWRCWERWHMCWSHAGKPPASWHNIICRVIFYNTDGQSLCCCCTLILETLLALSVLSRSDVMNVFVTYVTLQWQSLHCGVSMCDVGSVTVSLCDVGGVTVWQSPPVEPQCLHTVRAGAAGHTAPSSHLCQWCRDWQQWRMSVYTQWHTTTLPTHHHAGGHHRPRLHQGGQGGHCQSYHLHLCEQDPAVQGDNKQDRRGRECYLCNYGVVTSPQLGHTVTVWQAVFSPPVWWPQSLSTVVCVGVEMGWAHLASLSSLSQRAACPTSIQSDPSA